MKSILLRTVACAAAALLAPAAVLAQASGTLSVLYAGSLVTPMEGPIKAALAKDGIDFQGQGAGSKMLANLIAAGAKSPDVFVSADPKLVSGLGAKVATASAFASTSLGLGWSDKSKFAALLAGVAPDKAAILKALSTPGLSIGRTDPMLDPKGAYTVQAMIVLAGASGEKRILGDDENTAQIFPEEDLLARIDTGQADVGFFYKIEATARGLHFLALPGAASMSDKIAYTIALLKDAPHPGTAKAFVHFILNGEGRSILQKAGLEYFETPRAVVSSRFRR